MTEPPVEPSVRPDEWLLFVAIIGGCFGNAITSSVFFAFATTTHAAYSDGFNTANFLGLISFEIFTGLLAVVALAAAGWRGVDFPFRIDIPATAMGIGLVMLLLLASVLLAPASSPVEVEAAAPTPGVSLSTFLLLCVVNPFYEEFFVLGFVVRFFERRGSTNWRIQAAAASVAIRASYHLYQGADQLPFHIAMGAAFTVAFLHRRNLWPFILAHAALDALGLYSFVL